MRRSDDVFFFTLIDFLLQIFFFGLMLFVVNQVAQQGEAQARQTEERTKEELLRGAGVSSLTELTDMLTKMAPLNELRGTSDFLAKNGGAKGVESAVAAASAAGGIDKVGQMNKQIRSLTARVSELEGGWGKASCIPNIVVNGRTQPKSVARVIVEDDAITLEEPTEEMTALLVKHGLEFAIVQKLNLHQFRTMFAPVVSKQPECRYFLSVVTRTRYIEPMRAVWAVFRTQ